MTVTQPAEAAASQPASSQWRQTAKGVELQIPAGWQPRKNPDFELMLVPRTQSADPAQITFDIPDLPPHLPWMIQMTRIEHDYLADLKKKHPDLKRQEAGNATVSSATARLIHSIWHEDGKAYDDIVLLMIHANGVYILDAQTDNAHLPAARRAFDQIRASLKWSK